MNQQDRDFLTEHGKRIDDRHEALTSYLTVEFERINNHLSKLNGRTAKIEDNTAFARWVQRNPMWSIALMMIIIGLIVGLVEVTGLINLLKLV